MDKVVVYEYIECYVAISEIWLISLKTFEGVTSLFFALEIHN